MFEVGQRPCARQYGCRCIAKYLFFCVFFRKTLMLIQSRYAYAVFVLVVFIVFSFSHVYISMCKGRPKQGGFFMRLAATNRRATPCGACHPMPQLPASMATIAAASAARLQQQQQQQALETVWAANGNRAAAPPPVCASWCAANGNTWEVKCEKFEQCKGCAECPEPGQSYTLHTILQASVDSCSNR